MIAGPYQRSGIVLGEGDMVTQRIVNPSISGSSPDLPAIHIQGMHGLGDNIHQRAVVRQLMKRYRVTLETSWPSVYHDFDIGLARRNVSLRTQQKNSEREADKFVSRHPLTRSGMRISYTGQQVLASPSKTILEVMCNVTGTSFAEADFSFPIPDSWDHALDAALGPLPDRARGRPWVVYRPLCARPEWRGSMARNADPASYQELFNRIREQFFVISVADLVPTREWIVGPEMDADLKFHKGELHFELLAALMHRADLVFTSSGFAAVLGPAVGTPTISVIGGYEDTRCHDAGARHAPYLAIGPRVPCTCWTSACMRDCAKTIDMQIAGPAIDDFVSQTCIQTGDKQ
jgi:ADP-heptose:LPS heptosyltransferase